MNGFYEGIGSGGGWLDKIFSRQSQPSQEQVRPMGIGYLQGLLPSIGGQGASGFDPAMSAFYSGNQIFSPKSGSNRWGDWEALQFNKQRAINQDQLQNQLLMQAAQDQSRQRQIDSEFGRERRNSEYQLMMSQLGHANDLEKMRYGTYLRSGI